MNAINQLCSVLSNLGLTKKEIKIYKVVLNRGITTPTMISNLSGIDRSMCYKYLNNLKEKGLINETRLNKQKAFFAEPLNNVLRILNEKHDNLLLQKKIAQNAINNIIIDKSVKSFKPEIQYFDGFEGIKKMYLETLKGSKYIKIFFGWDFYTKELKKFIENEYIPARVKSGIHCEVIAIDSTIEDRDIEELRFRKKINLDLAPKVEINIYNDKVNFISILNGNYSGLMIRNKEIANSLEEIFDILWNKETPQ